MREGADGDGTAKDKEAEEEEAVAVEAMRSLLEVREVASLRSSILSSSDACREDARSTAQEHVSRVMQSSGKVE